MAIGRVAGNMLFSDLDRQGTNLRFTTNDSPLVTMDFSKFSVAINGNSLVTSPSFGSETFVVNGNVSLSTVKIDNGSISSANTISVTAPNVDLGPISNLHIAGGSTNYILVTDGSGGLSWASINDLSQITNLTGMGISLGNPGDNSLVDNAAYQSWTEATKVTTAIDDLNQVVLNVYQNTFVGNVDFTADIVSGPSPITVSFTPTVVGNPTEYFWDFGDSVTSTFRNPVHTYSNDLGGSYTVSFKASNPAGTLGGNGIGSFAENNKADYITLYTPAPIPAFSLSSTSIDTGSTVVFTNNSTNSDSFVVHWGDGTYDTVSTLTDAGAPGRPITHTYTNSGSDSQYFVTLDAFSNTAGPGGLTVTSSPMSVLVYSIQSPSFTVSPTVGNNQHTTVPNGLTVSFTNTTASHPGLTSVFTDNRYVWDWGDGQMTSVNIEAGTPGNYNSVIQHTYSLVDPEVEQEFSPTLRLVTGHTSSAFVSDSVPITVKAAPTSAFDAVPLVVSDRTGDGSVLTGYLFTDLTGKNRATFSWSNQSINADQFTWDYDDGVIDGPIALGDVGTPTGGPILHTYSSEGTFNPKLLAHGVNSISTTDDTLTKSGYIKIRPVPPAPLGLSGKTITLTSVGTTPLLVANAESNGNTLPAAGSSVIRITTVDPVSTNSIIDVYNSSDGSMRSIINGVSDLPVYFIVGDNTGVYGSLIITDDRDSHIISPTIYPSNFYTVFTGHISKSNSSVPVGFNTYQISHSLTGNTNVLAFVKDDVVAVPTIFTDETTTMSTDSIGSPKYISGLPYFGVAGRVAISNLKVYNWIGQTYLSTAPMSVSHSSLAEGVGSMVVTQAKSYSQINGETSYLVNNIPTANTGKDISSKYALGPVIFDVNGNAAGSGKVRVQMSNVNGQSGSVELPTLLNVYTNQITGFDELSIPVSASLGAGFTDNGKRIFIDGGVGLTPDINRTVDYYNSSAFVGPINVEPTDEAIVRFGTLAHNLNDYSGYLPIGPNLSLRTGTQYFRFAFRRTVLANFNFTFSGKISGIAIALPGSQIDATSTMNGWLDPTSVYAGAGVPGGNTSAGGNGSDGCAFNSGNLVPLNTLVTNHSSKLTLGAENTSNSPSNQILVCIALNPGDSITAISIG